MAGSISFSAAFAGKEVVAIKTADGTMKRAIWDKKLLRLCSRLLALSLLGEAAARAVADVVVSRWHVRVGISIV